ncbi:hypothetical protein OS493_016720 [Desmophyllum pertusum]|uniref:Uncharacterized protein n=1 Tax=Desmophyllum pertusum TaxID=174260 RepID=A0A9W9Z0N2_9CNID|nr:hypothetical protein OS493_016720 [Desmophyllum pertusum]
MEAEWNLPCISHHSLTTLNDRRHNHPDLLPSQVTFRSKGEEGEENSKDFVVRNLHQFALIGTKPQNQDVVASLQGHGNSSYSSRLDMVEIKGKRGRKVPILLTKDVKKAIDVLVEKRSGSRC